MSFLHISSLLVVSISLPLSCLFLHISSLLIVSISLPLPCLFLHISSLLVVSIFLPLSCLFLHISSPPAVSHFITLPPLLSLATYFLPSCFLVYIFISNSLASLMFDLSLVLSLTSYLFLTFADFCCISFFLLL